MRKPRSSNFNRTMSWRKALRKKRIASYYDITYYEHLHQYSKNKVHCSCPMCSAKTRNKGSRRQLRGNYAPSINYSYHDLKQQARMDESEKEYYFGGDVDWV